MRRFHRFAVALLVGCTSPSGPPPVTRLEVHAVPTLVSDCDADLETWAVKVRETGERFTSVCDQPIIVSALEPYLHYTLEISGYSREGNCWRLECPVTPSPGLGIADCAPSATQACGDAGAP